MMRPTVVPLACLCLALSAAPAFAVEDSPAALDLSLPAAPSTRNDPPGTWYGDTSGIPAAAAPTPRIARPACPTAPDGKPTDLTGSVGAGVGYSSRLGNSNYQAATLNWCKDYVDDGGDKGTVNVQLNVGNYDGPDVRRAVAPFPAPRGRWGR